MLSGLEIGARTIKALVLDNQHDACIVRHFVSAPVYHETALAAVLKSVLASIAPYGNTISLLLPYTAVFSKTIQLATTMSVRALEQFVLWNLASSFDVAIDELSYDFYLPDPSTVQVFAIKRSLVTWYQTMLQEAGFKLCCIEPNLFAIHRAIYLQVPSSCAKYAILYVEENTCGLIVFDHKKLWYVAAKPTRIWQSQEEVLAELDQYFPEHGINQEVQIIWCGTYPWQGMYNPFAKMQVPVAQEGILQVAPALVGCVGAALSGWHR